MDKPPKSPRKGRILAACLIVVAAVCIVIHLYLTSWLLGYVNDVLAHIDGYQGSVSGINLNLYRGAYQIKGLAINKKDGKIPTPFVSVDTADLSIQWSALLHGRVVSYITLTHPVVNFAVNKSSTQNGANVDWTKTIKDLMPIDINIVRFNNGSVTYKDFSSTPQVNIFVHNMDGEVQNLRNVEASGNALPSPVDVRGNSIGNGKLTIHGKMNILKKVPDMDLQFSLENVDLPALNSYSEAYAAIDFKSGSFSVYSNVIAKNSKISGYVKPIITHLSVDILKTANPLEIVWDTTVAAILKVFTNISKDQFATRADLDGDLDNVNTDGWTVFTGILRNAFISAITKGLDQSGHQDIIKKDQ